MVVAGAGMAGLVAAARARELGTSVRVLEKGDRPGGSMLLSSGVVWRYRDFEEYRRQCPGGDEQLQRLVWERLDDALDWLESIAGPAVPHTSNPLTTGRRFDPPALVEALVGAVGEITYGHGDLPPVTPLVLATGGYPVALARERGLLVRSNPWSEGDGIALARRHGAVEAPSAEFYGRAMPGPVPEDRYVAASQLYGRFARRVNDRGEDFFPGAVSWSEHDLVQAIADQPGGRAWFELDAEGLARPEVAERLPYAQETEPLPGGGRRIRVHAAVTQTYGGLRVDAWARAADGIWAAGADAGGLSNGGYASGLAQALVLGLAAAEDAVR
ncbi:MAG TPA: FAD-dependent oxidoreductase [Gaiellaceae bacterium]|nr:FAD-dependent oxidoreductase [Gaiellaceae bacterium]